MKSFVTVLVLGVLIVGGFYLYKNSSKSRETEVIETSASTNDLIVVSIPVFGAMISSPLAVSGKARGAWYFEGSFPITVVDDKGMVLGTGIGTAQGEWMTEEFVPFTGNITFTAPASDAANGKVIFHKDNPSGLSENDDVLEIPVQFVK